jgi:hypothetical protein
MGVSSRFLEIKNGKKLELCFAIGYISLLRGASDFGLTSWQPPAFLRRVVQKFSEILNMLFLATKFCSVEKRKNLCPYINIYLCSYFFIIFLLISLLFFTKNRQKKLIEQQGRAKRGRSCSYLLLCICILLFYIPSDSLINVRFARARTRTPSHRPSLFPPSWGRIQKAWGIEVTERTEQQQNIHKTYV